MAAAKADYSVARLVGDLVDQKADAMAVHWAVQMVAYLVVMRAGETAACSVERWAVQMVGRMAAYWAAAKADRLAGD